MYDFLPLEHNQIFELGFHLDQHKGDGDHFVQYLSGIYLVYCICFDTLQNSDPFWALEIGCGSCIILKALKTV